MGQLFKGSRVDLTITVEREKLIGILTDNRQKHEAHYKKAVEGYKKKLIEHAEENLALAKEGKHPKHFQSSQPRHYLPQYDRALGMLKLTVAVVDAVFEDTLVSLSAYDYARFVEDDWDWKEDFANLGSYYSPELSAELVVGASLGG